MKSMKLIGAADEIFQSYNIPHQNILIFTYQVPIKYLEKVLQFLKDFDQKYVVSNVDENKYSKKN